jgi:hypothetical protein
MGDIPFEAGKFGPYATEKFKLVIIISLITNVTRISRIELKILPE